MVRVIDSQRQQDDRRFENALEFREGFPRLRNKVERINAEDNVDASVLKWKMDCVGLHVNSGVP